MSTCLRGRLVTVGIRRRRRGPPQEAVLAVPERWSKSRLLRYVRGEHPEDSVRLVAWPISGWEPGVWLVDAESRFC